MTTSKTIADAMSAALPKQTSIGRRRKVGFLDLIPKSLRTIRPTGPRHSPGPSS